MNRTWRIILITFLESFGCTCALRGVFFLTSSMLGFTDMSNLALAGTFGLTYILGALLSHSQSKRFSEKNLLLSMLGGQILVFAAMAVWPSGLMIFIGQGLLGVLEGVKWPLIESYVSAGCTPKQASKTIGMFNISWAVAAPIALSISGPLIAFWVPSLFVLPGLFSLLAIWLALALPKNPIHLPHDHPERPDDESMGRLAGLTSSNRWLLLVSYAATYVLAAMLPKIFFSLGYGLTESTSMACVWEWVRAVVFVGMFFWIGWHNKTSLLWISLAAMPVGFFMIIFGPNLSTVIAGQVLFGLTAGTIYYSSLYYGMVVANASVHAGGRHEQLIGLGFVIGPMAGLLGSGLSETFSSGVLGMLLGMGPLFLICSAGAIRSMKIKVKTK